MSLRAKATLRVGLFSLGGRTFAVDAAAVRQVVSVPRVTPVPRSGPELLGLFAERGRVTPLLSLSVLLNLGDDARDLALLVQSGEHLFALAIDRMVGFERLEADPRADPSAFSSGGVLYKNERVSLLDLAKVGAALSSLTVQV